MPVIFRVSAKALAQGSALGLGGTGLAQGLTFMARNAKPIHHHKADLQFERFGFRVCEGILLAVIDLSQYTPASEEAE
jgi:hypothetical protein